MLLQCFFLAFFFFFCDPKNASIWLLKQCIFTQSCTEGGIVHIRVILQLLRPDRCYSLTGGWEEIALYRCRVAQMCCLCMYFPKIWFPLFGVLWFTLQPLPFMDGSPTKNGSCLLGLLVCSTLLSKAVSLFVCAQSWSRKSVLGWCSCLRMAHHVCTCGQWAFGWFTVDHSCQEPVRETCSSITAEWEISSLINDCCVFLIETRYCSIQGLLLFCTNSNLLSVTLREKSLLTAVHEKTHMRKAVGLQLKANKDVAPGGCVTRHLWRVVGHYSCITALSAL